MKIFFKRILVFVFLIALSVSVRANISVRASLDSVNILMGRTATLRIEVVENVGQKGELQIFKDISPQQSYVGICGDSIELNTSFVTDTVELGSGRIQVNYAIPVQSFDSGTYKLPQFLYVADGDTAMSNILMMSVEPLHLTADDPIAGLAPVAEPEGKKFYDAIPDWIFDFWWIFLIIALAIIISLWAMKKYRKGEMPLIKKVVELTPNQLAMERLAALKAKKLWEQGMEKEYFTELTEILRVYLQGRFGINAMEMTTRQIIDNLYSSDVKDKREYIRQILKVADFVKFAKVRPLPADNVDAFDNAVKFVEETAPEIVEEEANVENPVADDSGKGGDK